METLEYAVFALAFAVAISGFAVALGPGLTATYEDLGNWLADQATAMSDD